jgi:hypothetical protein
VDIRTASRAGLAVLVATMIAVHFRRSPAPSPSAQDTTGVEQPANTRPLTLGRANDLLTHAPSFTAALDAVAFERQRSQMPEGKRSALATLSKEDAKLRITRFDPSPCR